MFKNFLLIIILLGFSSRIYSQYSDDNSSFLDYTVKNKLSFYNDTSCNISLVTKIVMYRCRCKDSSICLKDYFNSYMFNSIKIRNKTLHKLCNISFTDSYNNDRCISCSHNISVYYTVDSESLCQEVYNFRKIIIFVEIFLVFGIAFVCILKIRYDRKYIHYLHLGN